MDYSSTISNYIRALNIEIKFLKESGGRKYRVFNITKLEKEQDGYIYALESDTELFLADSFPVRLEIKGRKYRIISILDKEKAGDIDEVSPDDYHNLTAFLTTTKTKNNGNKEK